MRCLNGKSLSRARLSPLRTTLLALFAFVWAACTTTQQTVREETPVWSDDQCTDAILHVKSNLANLFQSRDAGGDLVFRGANRFLERHPLLATIGWHIYQNDGDITFLQNVFETTTAYYRHLLGTHDADGDFLLERISWADPAENHRIEDVGYNSMLALDLASLSRIAAELDRPIDALYWYQGEKTISRRLIIATYDSRAGYFFPFDNGIRSRQTGYLALSALPTCFPFEVGENISRSVLSGYVLSDRYLSPETPAHYLNGSVDAAHAETGLTDDSLVRMLLLLESLYMNGYREEAEAYTKGLSASLISRWGSGTLYAQPQDRAYGGLFACLIMTGRVGTFLPTHITLPLLDRIVQTEGVFEDDQRAAHSGASAKLEGLLAGGMRGKPESKDAFAGEDSVAAEQAIRTVYWTISAMRQQREDRSLFSKRAVSAIPGFDPYSVLDGFLDETVGTVRLVETRLSTDRARSSGLAVRIDLERQTIAPGEPIRLQLSVAATREPVGVRSIVLQDRTTRRRIVDARPPVEVIPGLADRVYQIDYPTPKGIESAFVPVHLLAEVELADGQKFRYQFNNSVYVSTPLTFDVSFPRGRLLTGRKIPIDIHLEKHVSTETIAEIEWFSPAGLRLDEGPSHRVVMRKTDDRATFTVNVRVPSPARPGSFPFAIKVFGNGMRRGVVATSLFKPYEWLFVGPFAEATSGFDAAYPPEHSVSLQSTYEGLSGPIEWTTLPAQAHGSDGRIDLSSLLPYGTLGYLYTVIETEWQNQTTLSFNANVPAEVFINGASITRLEGTTPGNPRDIDVDLYPGSNNILIKVQSGPAAWLFFELGGEDDVASDEFNNDLAKLIDGYDVLRQRGRRSETPRLITLTYRNEKARSVAVIGSFNGWSPNDSPMRPVAPGEWEISLHLPPGRYAYRFILDSATQVLDPNCPTEEPDGFGGKNSILLVR